MRIPKVGERWLRHDGKSNTVTIIGVVAATPSIAIKVQYRYDDGVESEKLLPDFHAKFKEPAAYHEWLERVAAPEPVLVTGNSGVVVGERPEPVRIPTSAEMRRYHGFKDDEPIDGPRQGNWNDPDYRARYYGLKS